MTTTVNLMLKANTSSINDDLVNQLEKAVSKSCCWVIGKVSSVGSFQMQIRAFSEKLEKLRYELEGTGVTLADNSAAMISNAATQYSVFRDIEITLDLRQS